MSGKSSEEKKDREKARDDHIIFVSENAPMTFESAFSVCMLSFICMYVLLS